MKQIQNMVARVIEIAATFMVIVVNFTLLVACNDEGLRVESKTASIVTPIEEDDRYVTYDFSIVCNNDNSFISHTGTSTIDVFVDGSDEPEKEMKKVLKSTVNIDRTPDTVRVSAVGNEVQTNVSIARSFRNNKENDEILISVSDGRTLVLNFEAEHANEKYLGEVYTHGHDSLLSARLIKVEQFERVTRAAAVASQYVKNTYDTEYSVEVTTAAVYGNGTVGKTHSDVLKTRAVTLVLADNNSVINKTNTGVKVINDEQQADSVVITRTWDDGHKENMTFNTILNRSIKNIEKREVIVGSFDAQNAGNSFSSVAGGERFVRSDANWTVYGRDVVITKMVSVDGHSEEIRYTLYQERAEFNYEGVNHTFAYVDWTVGNYDDNFKNTVSNKNGYDELDYTNQIRTSYLGYVQFANEVVAWFKAEIKINGYGVENAARIDYPTYTLVSLDKYAYYTDGTSKKVGSFNAKLPIEVKPLTNWVLNETVWGVYTSDEFAGTQVGKTAKTAEKFFSYNNYTYNYANNVAAGPVNKLAVSVPNDIVFNDGDVEYAFNNSNLVVEKKNENTALKAETAENTTYTYACVANVNFGGAEQTVNLPGTINLKKDNRNHEHGKVVATYMYTTLNEGGDYQKSTATIAFADGYKMIAVADYSAMTFEFTMNSKASGVNSACWNGYSWVPSIASDNAKYMLWKNENGGNMRSLNYVTATAKRWNDGHNTVVDLRREGKISADGYSVTFYLNGIAGQTLEF